MPLSGYSSIPARTWALRGTGTYDGELLRVTDQGGPMGFLAGWSVSLSRWLGLHAVDLAPVAALTNGTAQTAEQVMPGQILIPAGLLMAFRKIRSSPGLAKSGGTDAMSNWKQKLGTAGTTADTQISNTYTTVLGSANRSFGIRKIYQITDAVTITRVGSESGGNTASGSDSGVASSVVAGVAVTVSDMSSNALYFSNTITMAGTTDTPQVAGQILELIP